jgi:hypothetical protein
MDILHTSIAHFLRTKRLPDRTFRCTRCNTIVRGGQGLYHLEELRLAGECAYCHGPSTHRAALGLAGESAVLPRPQPLCKHCGDAIGETPSPELLTVLLSERVCADCHQPF